MSPGRALRAAGSRETWPLPAAGREGGGSRGGSARRRKGRARGWRGQRAQEAPRKGSRVTAALLASAGLPREGWLAGFSIRALRTRAGVQGAKLARADTLLQARGRAAAASRFGRGNALSGRLDGRRKSRCAAQVPGTPGSWYSQACPDVKSKIRELQGFPRTW